MNYRSRLWGPAAARAATEALLPLVDVLFVGNEEAAALWDWEVEAALDHLSDAGPAEVVLKLGAKGCTALLDGERLGSAGLAAREVDPIGAGDAFAAGYLAATLWGRPGKERLRIANAMGALCVLTGTEDKLKVGCKPSDAPAGGLKLTDGVRKTAADYLSRFPYLNTPIPGNRADSQAGTQSGNSSGNQ